MMHGYGSGMMGGFGGGNTWIGIVGMSLHALFWVALIVLAVYFIRRWSNHSNIHKASNALNILDDRFVKGEINSDQYKQMKKDLLS